jgi:anti-anti-sigma factor
MEITTIPGTVTILEIQGDIDASTFSRLIEEAEHQLASGNTRLLLDLGGVDYVSSAGLVAVQSIAGRASAAGGKSALCGLSPRVMKVFDIAGFARLLPLFPDRETAVKSLET